MTVIRTGVMRAETPPARTRTRKSQSSRPHVAVYQKAHFSGVCGQAPLEAGICQRGGFVEIVVGRWRL
jgi:hypothetical protein